MNPQLVTYAYQSDWLAGLSEALNGGSVRVFNPKEYVTEKGLLKVGKTIYTIKHHISEADMKNMLENIGVNEKTPRYESNR